MPLAFTDGTTLYGLPQVTLGGLSFYANDLSAEAPIEVKNLLDEVGSPRKAVGVHQKRTGTYTLQLDSTGAQTSASNATTCSITQENSPSGSATFTAWITGRSLAKSNESFATLTIQWEEKLNA
jgi:hypothetical protein